MIKKYIKTNVEWIISLAKIYYFSDEILRSIDIRNL